MRVVFLFLLAGVSCSIAIARPIPALNVVALTRAADEILVGKVMAIRQVGEITLDVQGQAVSVNRMHVALRVDRTLKGNSNEHVIYFEFLLDRVGGFRFIPVNQYGIFSLVRKPTKELVPVDPNFPFLVALPSPPAIESDVFDRVVAEVANVIMKNAAREKRIEAIETLQYVRSDRALVALRKASADLDPSLRLRALAALLRNNDSASLDEAVTLLLNPPTGSEQWLLDNLAAAVNGIQDPKTIPLLTRLMTARDANPRRAAAYALRQTAVNEALKPLSRALMDGDREVRYQAVIGLAEITGQYEWGPSLEIFERDEGRYLTYWKQWSKKQ